MEHMHGWIKRLMGGMDLRVEEEARAKILEECGRGCIPRGFIADIKAVWETSNDLDDLVAKINDAWESAGADAHMRREGEEVYAVYGRCYCPLVGDYPDELSPSWCHCSRGWLLELFESALETPAQVELEKSVKRGDDVCRFKITRSP